MITPNPPTSENIPMPPFTEGGAAFHMEWDAMCRWVDFLAHPKIRSKSNSGPAAHALDRRITGEDKEIVKDPSL